MKFSLFLVLAFFANLAVAEPTDAKKLLAEKFKSDELFQVISPIKVSSDIYTPYFVRFVKKEDAAPTCVLIDTSAQNAPYELTAPFDTYLGNCHLPPTKPTIIKYKGHHFGIYTYVVEDPSKDFNTLFQLVKLTSKGALGCKEDAKITEQLKALSTKKTRLDAAAKLVLNEFGCTETPLFVPRK